MNLSVKKTQRRLRDQSLVGEHTGGNKLIFLSHIDVSLSLSLSKQCKTVLRLEKKMKTWDMVAALSIFED